MLMRLVWLFIPCALLSGCFISAAGAACDTTIPCPVGFACDSTGHCAGSGSDATSCSPPCNALERCVAGVCTDPCGGRACPPGSSCEATPTGAQCLAVGAGPVLGASCHADADCGSLPFVCLLPYGNTSPGVCTEVCVASANPCAEAGESCRTFPTDPEAGVINLCAPAALTPCHSDADCVTSGLVCEIMHVNISLSEAATATYSSVAVCGAPVAASNAALPGASCNLSGAGTCESGLCVATSSGANGVDANGICTTPCQHSSDCQTFAAAGNGRASCLPVSIKDQTGDPITRALLCVPGSSGTVGLDCNGNTPVCESDAPDCVPSQSDPTKKICEPYCVSGNSPCVSEGHTSTCNTGSLMYAGICY